MTFPLKNLPLDINLIVRKEQIRLEIEEGIKLKKEQVYYNIVREWYEVKKQKIANHGK